MNQPMIASQARIQSRGARHGAWARWIHKAQQPQVASARLITVRRNGATVMDILPVSVADRQARAVPWFQALLRCGRARRANWGSSEKCSSTLAATCSLSLSTQIIW